MYNDVQALPQQMQRLIGSSVTESWTAMDWRPIHTAPFDRDLQLSVIEHDEVHSLVFPCIRTANGWQHGVTNKTVPVRPTHWRHWDGVCNKGKAT
jgi:hypothetical protein